MHVLTFMISMFLHSDQLEIGFIFYVLAFSHRQIEMYGQKFTVGKNVDTNIDVVINLNFK